MKTKARIASLTIIAGLVTVGACDSDSEQTTEDTASPSGGKSDGVTGEIVIAEAGAFRNDGLTIPTAIVYGFTDSHAPGWESAGELEITYDENGESQAIALEMPADTTAPLIGFVIQSVPKLGTADIWGHDQFISLDAPEGSFVTLPLRNSASYPFSDECYDVSVDGESYDGLIRQVLYGFTDASRDDYDANNDVAWQNVLGEDEAEGAVATLHRHDGGFKGSMVLDEVMVRVPAGLNVVFKLDLDLYSGDCGRDNDTQWRESTWTKTYFSAGE